MNSYKQMLERTGQATDRTTQTPVSALDPFGQAAYSTLDGSKFAGGFGETKLHQVDYWTLRARSVQLFQDNLYARGIIRRLVTNEINTGLSLEAIPEETVLGMEEDSLNDWAENVENRFALWANSPDQCDDKRRQTFGGLQKEARATALIAGDVLVVMRQNQQTKRPTLQLISGASVVTPLQDPRGLRKGHEITHGVEMNPRGEQVAYWVRQKDGTTKRLPARGEKSGRRLAWLVYGTDKLLDDVRGQPILAIVLQSLKEIDRYRDSTQRKAVINSILAMFIEKTEDKPGTLPITGGAVRKDTVTADDGAGEPRNFNIASQIPGLVMEELQTGEKPVGFNSQGTDVNFGTFEESIIQAVAWANQIPPEILRLAFSNNYSASQAAINEFKIYLNSVRTEFGAQFCQPVYTDWLISSALLRKIPAPSLITAWRNPAEADMFAAWVYSDWSGAIKPSTDIKKQAAGYKLLNDEGWITNERASRELTGTKFSKNIRRIKRENELKAEAARPLLELKQEFGDADTEAAISALADDIADSIQDNTEV